MLFFVSIIFIDPMFIMSTWWLFTWERAVENGKLIFEVAAEGVLKGSAFLSAWSFSSTQGHASGLHVIWARRTEDQPIGSAESKYDLCRGKLTIGFFKVGVSIVDWNNSDDVIASKAENVINQISVIKIGR